MNYPHLSAFGRRSLTSQPATNGICLKEWDLCFSYFRVDPGKALQGGIPFSGEDVVPTLASLHDHSGIVRKSTQ